MHDAMKLSEYQKLGDDVDDKRKMRNIALGIAGAVWLFNVIDAYLESRLEVQKYYQTIKTHPHSAVLSGDVENLWYPSRKSFLSWRISDGNDYVHDVADRSLGHLGWLLSED